MVLECFVELSHVMVDTPKVTQAARHDPLVPDLARYRQRFRVVLQRLVELAFVVVDVPGVAEVNRHGPLVPD